LAHGQNQWSVFEDLLWWKASQQTTSIWAYQFMFKGLSGDQGTYFTEPNTYFGSNAGLRLGARFKNNSNPDVSFYWTHFSTKANEAVNAPQGKLLLPEFFNGFTAQNIATSAQLNWRLEMNILDAKLGQDYHPTQGLTLHPSVGLKGGMVNQSIQSAWQMNLFDLLLYNASEDLKNNFSGIGPSLSVDGVWTLYKGLSIQSTLETALLWGHWTVQDVFDRPNNLILGKKFIQSTTNDSLATFMTRYFLGLQWQAPVKTLTKLRAGYEMQFWSNQLRLPMFQALPIHGDLTLQGGTCGIYINL
jgi:hypothetical protein